MSDKMRLLSVGMLLALAGGLQPGSTDAATVTTTFEVTANIMVNCTLSANILAFGTYVPGLPTPLDVQSDITVDCTNGATWDIGLNQGLHGPSVNARAMANNTAPSVLLNYSLFSDPAHTINWGNTIGTDTVSGTGTGSAEIVSVYGRIPAGQTTATSGGYADTITATITF